MKFRVTMKDPDGAWESLKDAAEMSASEATGLSKEERTALQESRQDQLAHFAKGWMEYNEYITVEFDTDAGTAIVVPVK